MIGSTAVGAAISEDNTTQNIYTYLENGGEEC